MAISSIYGKILLSLGTACVCCSGFSQKQEKFKTKYSYDDLNLVTEAPDYSQMNYWVAHPEVKDMADLIPGKGELMEYQSTADVDVFFIYPTIYTKKQHKDHPWFADVNDEKLNDNIAKSTIKYQATVFNASGKVYAPLYRQAHIGVYYANDLSLKVDALEFAYRDVKKAFEYYLENWNNGRPIIIASHSQGTNHAVSLLRDFFESKPLMKQLVAAYIVGMPVDKGTFSYIPTCDDPTDTGCWLTWNTYAKNYYPPDHDIWYEYAFSVNPLSWKSDTTRISFGENKGGILRNYKKIRPGLSDAQSINGMVWINKLQFFWGFLFKWDRYHIADYNLFYMNIRENVAERVDAYLKKQPD